MVWTDEADCELSEGSAVGPEEVRCVSVNYGFVVCETCGCPEVTAVVVMYCSDEVWRMVEAVWCVCEDVPWGLSVVSEVVSDEVVALMVCVVTVDSDVVSV